ncbi:MAG: thiamine-phosphate kinase [Candidatus Lindowbacteria bacterium RIFCSPLOWO2_12_FULL_62_27]|nr:MAG: thiamine-phosphate kinase [Candidatus Lindowbacteria bacterium RIFCSPLOWO2_12_FULL_62_27]
MGMREQSLLEEIARRFRPGVADRRRGVRVGAGDDAALVRMGGTDVALTVDAVVEGVDFDLRYFGWSDVGYKALSAAVSDLYACGATPVAFLVTAGIPAGAKPTKIRSLLGGLQAAAAEHRATIVGGDLTRAPKLMLDVCAIGQAGKRFLRRSGARRGDMIFVSGPVGSSRAALLMFRRGLRVPRALRAAHLRPAAARRAGRDLSKEPRVTAMMDVSDGLLMDLSRLCRASRVGAGLVPSHLPVTSEARAAFRRLGKDPVQEAAIGGEDYVLLFTVRPPVPRHIRRRYACIGRILNPSPVGGPIYNMERRPPRRMVVKGFLHRF